MNDWQVACRRIACEEVSNKNSDCCNKPSKQFVEICVDCVTDDDVI